MDLPGNSQPHVPLQEIQHSVILRSQRSRDGGSSVPGRRAAAGVCQVFPQPHTQSLSGVAFPSETAVLCASYQPCSPSNFNTEQRESRKQLKKGKKTYVDISLIMSTKEDKDSFPFH